MRKFQSTVASSPAPTPPPKIGLFACTKQTTFLRICKITNTYHTYITNRAELAASLGNLLFAKTLSCAISVVKIDHVQDGAATSHVRREISIAVATNRPKK